MSRLLILPSPLLPETAYRDLAAALADRGAEVEIASSALGGDAGAHDLVRRWSDLFEPERVLVAHSNAGYLAPLVRAAAGVRSPIVFVDAALPPASGATPLAPPAFRALLAERVGPDGLLPPWTRWWPRSVMSDVVPTHALSELDRDCPRLALGYFDAVVEAPSGWTAGPNAYLAFGATYADELSTARESGWPHATLEGGHLHFMHDPAAVAELVEALAETALEPKGDDPR